MKYCTRHNQGCKVRKPQEDDQFINEQTGKPTQMCASCRKRKKEADYDKMKKAHGDSWASQLGKKKAIEDLCTKSQSIRRNRENRHLLTQQDFKCAICSTAIEGKNACLDHCHRSGVVRGWLCRTCNMGLGLFKDNTDIMSKAAIYLEKFDANMHT